MARHSPSSETLAGSQATETSHLGSGNGSTLSAVGDRGGFCRENGARDVCSEVGKRGEGQTWRPQKKQHFWGARRQKASQVGAHCRESSRLPEVAGSSCGVGEADSRVLPILCVIHG